MTRLCAGSHQRFNNCLQILSCICDILAMFISQLQGAAAIIRLIAKIVYLMYVVALSCLTLQNAGVHAGTGSTVPCRAL